MTGGKGEEVPPSTRQLLAEAQAAQEEEWRARDAFLSHLKALDDLDPREPESDTASAYRLANSVIALSEGGTDMDEDTVRLARAYLDAFKKSGDASRLVVAEYAVSQPEHLETLNREPSLEEVWEVIDRMKREIDESQGEGAPSRGEEAEEPPER